MHGDGLFAFYRVETLSAWGFGREFARFNDPKESASDASKCGGIDNPSFTALERLIATLFIMNRP